MQVIWYKYFSHVVQKYRLRTFRCILMPNEFSYEPLTTEQITYICAEHSALVSEKVAVLEQIDKDRIFGLTASGVTWAWFATQHSSLRGADAWMRWMVFLPAVVIVFLIVMRAIHSIAVTQIGTYVKRIERHILPKKIGWETWLVKHRTERYLFADVVYWALLFVTNVVLAVVGFYYW